MSSYFIGIDNGGTLCKAVVFDVHGKSVGKAVEKLVLLTPQSGFTERDMNELWRVNHSVILNAIKISGINPTQIKGIACSGHGKGLYLWGKDGKPARNGIVSTDTRAGSVVAQWMKEGVADKIFPITQQSIMACQQVALLSWIQEHEPQVMENIDWIFSVKDYIRFRLTGDAFAEITDISGSNLVNLTTKNYDDEILEIFSLQGIRSALPPIKGSVEICGRVSAESAKLTGVPEGTPVAGGMFDIDACAIAMDIIDDTKLCVIAGTWGINEYIARKPVLNRSISMNSLYCIDGYYLIEESSPTSAGNLEWFISTYMATQEDSYAVCDALASQVKPDESDIIFLPFIFGSNYNPDAKSCFLGMDSHHTKAQIIRSVYEGIIYCHLIHIEKLLANNSNFTSIRLAGGVAKAEFWAQMFADIIGLPVEIIETEELGAQGVAIAAGVAVGEYASLVDAAKKIVKVKKKLIPDVSLKDVYQKKFQRYKKFSQALDSLW
jgi:L-xylulokinase